MSASDSLEIAIPFPFDQAYSATIYAYEDRYTWMDRKPYEEIEVDNDSSRHLELRDKDLSARIKESVVIKGEDLDRLYSIFHSDQCGRGEITFCYSPRHLMLFYDAEGALLGGIEQCLVCSNGLPTKGIEFPPFCAGKSDSLKAFFNEMGITYFGE